MKPLILHSPVEDRGGLEARAHPLCGCRWWNKPIPQIYVHNHRGSHFIRNSVLHALHGLVICPESLPPAKLAGFSSLIKHTLPTATTHLYIIIFAILFYIETQMITINSCQNMVDNQLYTSYTPNIHWYGRWYGATYILYSLQLTPLILIQ